MYIIAMPLIIVVCGSHCLHAWVMALNNQSQNVEVCMKTKHFLHDSVQYSHNRILIQSQSASLLAIYDRHMHLTLHFVNFI